MSKSKGDFLTLSVLEKKGYKPLAYRYFLLMSSYRNQLSFSFDGLDQAANAYNKLLNRIKNIEIDNSEINQEYKEEYINDFKNTLIDNLNTSNSITLLYDVIKDDKLNNNTKLEIIKEIDKVLSLNLLETNQITDELKNYIEEMINKRNIAKQNKDFVLSDKIRDELKEKCILIKDTREKTEYYLEV